MFNAIRNAQGRIISLAETPQENSTPVNIHDPEVISFLTKGGDSTSPLEFLQQSDAETSRIIEDLIDLLIAKRAILFTDLPEMAQQKLLRRKLARSATSNDETGSNAPQSPDTFILVDDETI
ncbi:MAG: hypothetical protein V7731_05920 [Amphritea sp.]